MEMGGIESYKIVPNTCFMDSHLENARYGFPFDQATKDKWQMALLPARLEFDAREVLPARYVRAV
jgi:hypothetical protein